MPSKFCLLATAPFLLAAPLAHAAPGMSALEQVIEQKNQRIAELEKENAELKARITHPGAAAVPSAPSIPAATPSGDTAHANWTGKTYTLERGDNLDKISKKCAVAVEDLIKLNGIKDPKKLQIGQVLKLPDTAKLPSEQPLTPAVPKPSSAKPGTPKPTAGVQPEIPNPVSGTTGTAGPATTQPAVAKPAKTMLKLVVIPEQTTYAAIAEKYGTTTEKLNELNKYSFGPSKVLAGGSELWVPETQQ